MYARKFTLVDMLLCPKGQTHLKPSPEGVQVHWIVSANTPSAPNTQLQLDAVEYDMASGFCVWMQPWRYIGKHCAMQVHVRGLLLRSCHGWTIDGIIITSSSKCAFHLSKADRMVFHNGGKIWKPDWQWINLNIYTFLSEFYIMGTKFPNSDSLRPIITK